MNQFRFTQLLLVPILFGAASCASSTVYGPRFDDKIGALKREVTTKQEVITALGNPREVLPKQNGEEMMIYETVTDRRDFKWFGPNLLKRTTRRLSIVMSHDGKLREYRIDDLYTELPYYGGSQSSANGDYYYPSSRYGAALSAGVDF